MEYNEKRKLKNSERIIVLFYNYSDNFGVDINLYISIQLYRKK